jgi:carnitine-CoA ligase
MGELSPFEGLNLTLLLEQRARERPEHPFLVWAPFEGEQRRWNYKDFQHTVAQLAAGLAARGISPGDRVLIHFENCPEALFARFALARLGAICVASNAMAAGPEIAHYAESSRAVAALTQSKFAALVANHGRTLRWVEAIDEETSFNALLAEPQAAYPSHHSDTAAIMFTTGTTGKPKGVVWTEANVLWGARFGAQVYGHRSDDISLIFLPLFHVVGLCWSFLPVLWSGGSAVLQPRFSASRFWPASIAHRATLTSHVLFTLQALNQQDVPGHHYYRQWTVARGDDASQMRNRIPRFVPSWGMTELMAPAIHGDPSRDMPDGALGRPSMAHTVRVTTSDGQIVKNGETGELAVRGVRGLSIFKHYDGNEDATHAAFDGDGFFRTGDRVTLVEGGYIRFSDRASDVIKVGGEGVSPSEIETVVRAVPGVREVAVIAAPDPVYGQVPIAFVEGTLAEAADLDADIMKSCRDSLAKFKIPRRVIVLDQLPRVGNGKIAKIRLREMLE